MPANNQKKTQTRVFNASQSATAMLLVAFWAGCNGQKSEVSDSNITQDSSNASADATNVPISNTLDSGPDSGGLSPEAAGAADTEPKSPPGTLELPSDFDSTPSANEGDANGSEPGGIELPPDVDISVDATSADTGPSVKFATWQEIDQFAKSAGRITVIDLWSLACEPCLEEFPGLVKLHQTMGDSVQCVAVDVDYDGRKSRPPEYYQKRILDFLRSVRASGFPTYISKTPSDDVFKTTKLISIPAVMIYNAKGEVVKVFVDTGEDNAFTYEKDVVPFVKSLAG